MGKTYWMQLADISSSSHVELDEEKYQTLMQARQTLIDLNAFEQKYEILLNNYRDFEINCARRSLISVTSSDHGYAFANEVLAEANRMFMNFLTAHQSYVDQVVQDFKNLDLGDPLEAVGIEATVTFQQLAEGALSRVYDASSEYRAICAIRNHAQHSAPPIHGVKGESNRCWAESLVFYSQKTVLSQNKKFKASVLRELDDSVDIRNICKKAMEHISAVHVKLRVLVRNQCELARLCVEQAHAEIQASLEASEIAYALWICAQDTDSEEVQRTILMLQWDDARKILQDRNRRPISRIRV
ncbi:hypothetical protein I5U65_00390 [Stenotrophomonas maltophilia]|nr:hypothetical protein [Stenotrophomonas maltophilia]